jgi:hypothetical protein
MPYTGSKKKEGVDFKNLDPIFAHFDAVTND